ncbi:unnamed protein product [Periconia digitata]|uniref:Uncharacterized protein n=1 Tax=Periconia digitata TaxID=1303443 RepID=A0A9W4U775_9PLEO|nr:unnamed protein product [Periconia digitata]
MASPTTSDLGQFFDFGNASAPESTTALSRPASRNDKHRVGCPAHGQARDDGCLCHAFDQDPGLPDHVNDEVATEDFNTDFSHWLPHYQKAVQPCDHCRSKSMECFIIYRANDGKPSACSPCKALFRPCSFNTSEQQLVIQKSKTSLDTLGIVAEHSEQLFGGQTGKKPLRSLGYIGPIEDESVGENGPKRGAAAARFPRASVKILKDWLISHLDHPYPTEEEKEQLRDQTGLSINQISNWMANTRRRQKARPKRSASPSIRPSTEAINIPPGRTWDDLNPMERWKHSPPENEPAPMQAIAHNVEHFEFPESTSLSSSLSYNKEPSNDSTGSFSIFRAPSTTSLETGFTAISSGSLGSMNSAYSHSSRHSLGSFNSLKSKERRRRRRLPTRTSKYDQTDAARMFQCTFCTDCFKSKYDWARHEKSLHLSLEKWICAPLGEVITCSASGQRKCVFCDEIEPSQEHLETHDQPTCQSKGLEARTFYRKDHLRQHLRLMHSCKMSPSMESWKIETQDIASRCGFCSMTFEKWQDRVDHLAKEFRNGATMKQWKGCRGLGAEVASQVTNAMPPYLIANESKSPFPFSASNSSSVGQQGMYMLPADLEAVIPVGLPDNATFEAGLQTTQADGSPGSKSGTNKLTDDSEADARATCWEILTLRLGRFARQYMDKYSTNNIPDSILQSKARCVLYGEDDPWHQTAADNTDWLNLFKQAHGIHGSYTPVPTLDALEDLGVRPNSNLDPSFDLSNFKCLTNADADAASLALAYECSLSGSLNMARLGHASVPPPITGFPSLSGSVPTTTGSLSQFSSMADFTTLGAPISEMECIGGPGGLCMGENGEIGLASSQQVGECTRFQADALGTHMIPPISESGFTSFGEPTANDLGLVNWDQLGNGNMDFAASTASLAASLNATSDLGKLGFSSSSELENIIGAATTEPMTWDDSELTFNMDMDMDMNTGFSLT